jgi:hypothetical protein
MRRITLLLIAAICGFSMGSNAQDKTAFDARFFKVLQGIFDNFTNTDLQRAFRDAQPIRCADLVGDWRPAAFFNDDPNLERWVYKTFEEVQADLSRYIFRGNCTSDFARLDVTTRFPIRESLDAYNSGKIEFSKIAFRINPAVPAEFDARIRQYGFELPYLYVTGRRNNTNHYSLVPPDSSIKQTEEVTNRYDCKAVKADDVTYRFAICRTVIVPRNSALRSQAEAVRGTSAYVILTDGKEAVSTVSLSFAGSVPKDPPGKVPSKVMDLSRTPFRLVFPRAAWEASIDSVMIVAGGRLHFPESAPTAKGDYCEWIPQSPATARLVNDTDKTIRYLLDIANRNGTTGATASFEARTPDNYRLGTLRCFFAEAETSYDVDIARLTAIFGEQITLEYN